MSTIDNTGGLQQPIEREINTIYNYLYDCASVRSPQVAIEEFNLLFAQGKNKNIEVSQALNKILTLPISQLQFDLFFSHCFYLIFNCWVANPEFLPYMSELFQNIAVISTASSYDRRRKQLIKLISGYQQSRAYLKLKAVINIINSSIEKSKNKYTQKEVKTNSEISGNKKEERTVNFYIHRYTFLYQHFYPQNLELEHLNKFIQSLQNSRRKDFEIKLSQHIIYRFRLKQVAKANLLSKGAGKIITKVDNPCLLSEKAFRVAIQQYVGKTERKNLLERAQKIIADNEKGSCYKTFKQDLYLFLIQDIKPRHSGYQFKQRLKNRIETIFPTSNKKSLNNTLVLQTCRQLFSFFIVESNSKINRQIFVDLVTNLGTAQAMMILIKITLICPESKSDLEKKIFSIVHHYQSHNILDVPWVVKALEHLLIAFSIYFGKIDVSLAQSTVSKQS